METFSSLWHILGNPATGVGALFYAVVILFLAWIVAHFLHILICRHLDRAESKGMDSTSFRFLDELGKVLVYVVALLLYVHFIPALSSLGTAGLASIGVVSLVVGLATQSTLSNVVAGFSIILYRPFRIGDRIQVTVPTGTEIGTVERVDLGYTTLRTSDGRRLVFSNSTIANLTSINLSQNKAHVPCDITITIGKDENIESARNILLEVAKQIPQINRVKGCFVTTVGAAGIVFTLSILCVDPGDVAQIKSEVLEKAKAQFDKNKISIA